MLHQRLHLWLAVVLLHLVFWVQAQQDTATALPEILIRANALRNALPGEYAEHFDRSRLQFVAHQSVADLLASQSGIYVKSYGLGSLATLSMRGSSASQVAILWNGLPIQSPMLGLTDMALLPAFLIDAVDLRYGNSGAQGGSGAIGGTLALSNTPPPQGFGLTYSGSIGSFGAQSHQAKLHMARKKWSISSRWLQSVADNDFTYQLTPQISRQQTNAQAKQAGFLQEFYYSPNERQQWSVLLWRQLNQRQIPPLTTQNRSVAQQADSVWRVLLQGRFFVKKHVFQIKSAFFDEKINYQDAAFLIKAPSGFQTAIGELTDKWQWNSYWSAQMGGQFTAFSATANGYTDAVQENRASVFANLRLDYRRWQIQGTARQEWQDGRPIPFMPGCGFAYSPLQWLRWSGKISRHYRLPTLNERYWRPGGNLELLPEQGWGGETGLVLKPHAGWQITTTAFHRYIHNWILWAVLEGQVFVSANNITAVKSRGVEQRLNWRHQWRQWYFDHSVGYDWVRSTNEIRVNKPVLPAGAQLIYTPLHRGFAHIYTRWNTIGLLWQSQLTSAVGGINEDVPAFGVHHIRLDYTFRHRAFNTQLFFQTNNIFNQSYQVIERRPMPGRAFMAGITTHFSH